MGNSDLGELAARICAGLDGVRACLLLSPDGLTLGAYPSGGEDQGRDAWDRLEALGAPVRGFVDLGEEVWVIARRGPYTAVLVSAPTVRPGLLLDRVEALLRAAEETRVQTATTGPPQPARRPRTSLHRETKSRETESQEAPSASGPDEPEERSPSRPVPAQASAAAPKYSPPEQLASAAKNVIDVSQLEGDDPGAAEEDAPEAGAVAQPAPGAEEAAKPTPPGNGHEIDRVALAREFGRLIADAETPEDQ